jgi:nitrile hydratase accessory protein
MSDPGSIALAEAPAFREPWQAKAFALVVLLHREGHFAWNDWVQTLAREIAAAPQRVGEDAEQAYHRQVLAALELIVARRGIATPAALQVRAEAWRRAYLNTPHGHPVELAAAEPGGPYDHDDGDDGGHHYRNHHDHELLAQRVPIAVCPRRREA